MRLDLAENAINEAGIEHVHAHNTVTIGIIFDWGNWVVVSQEQPAGQTMPADEDFQVNVGPLDSAEALALLDEDAAARPEMEAIQAEQSQEAIQSPTPAPIYMGTAEDFGLPEVYAVDRGRTNDGGERPNLIPSDLAVFALQIRETDPDTADRMADAIMAAPAAWCTFWLPRHTPDQFADWRQQATDEATAFADDMDVAFTTQNPPEVNEVLSRTLNLAGETFCPEQAANPGQPVEPTPIGSAAVTDEVLVQFDDAVLDAMYSSNVYQVPRPIDRRDLELAYITMIGMPTNTWSVKLWPVRLACWQAEEFAAPGYWEEHAETIRERNWLSPVISIVEQQEWIAQHEPTVFGMLVNQDMACT